MAGRDYKLSELMTVAEAASTLELLTRTITTYFRRGTLRRAKIVGNKPFLLRRDVAAYKRKRRRK